MGLAPVPYAPMVIGLPDAPDLVSLIVPTKVFPLLKRILSPGIKPDEAEFTFEMDFHGVDEDNPFDESLPDELT